MDAKIFFLSIFKRGWFCFANIPLSSTTEIDMLFRRDEESEHTIAGIPNDGSFDKLAVWQRQRYMNLKYSHDKVCWA